MPPVNVEETRDNLEERGEDSEKSQDNEEVRKEGANSDASSNDRSSSYMIVILPPGESSSVNTTQGSSQGSEADEDVVSADLGYPTTDTPSMNTVSPGASPLRRTMSGDTDTPDAGEWKHGWQFYTSNAREHQARTQLLSNQSPTEQARM